MTLDEIMDDCPSLEMLLRAKEGRIARTIELALMEAIDDIKAADKPKDAIRQVKLTFKMQPEADCGEARVMLEDPTVVVAKRVKEPVQMAIVDSAQGAKFHALGLEQQHTGHGLSVE